MAAGISDRLRMASERVTGTGPGPLTGDVRIEHDSLGERELPDEVYYGVQTLRAMENFAISSVFVKSFEHTIEALAFVKKAAAQAEAFADVLKMGRTENQDAVPMTLGQEFSAYGVMIESAAAALKRTEDEFHNINMGATAIGTGINSPPGYADLVTRKLSDISGFELRRARNLVEATQNAGAFAQMSATMKRAAAARACSRRRRFLRRSYWVTS